MFKKLKQPKEGFTIIEVLIVLAIAALILLIVFLAVPALQRSSRNTQRKNDVAAIGGAVANYISNNNGTLPNSLSDDPANTNTNNIAVSRGTSGNTESATLGYYTSAGNIGLGGATSRDGNIWISTAGGATILPTTTAPGSESATQVSTNSVIIIAGQDCTPTLNSRTAALYFATESGSGNGALQCIEQ